ncbi:MAG: hypothetical protein ACRDVN_01875 [Jiangellaceae bacterium]
MSEPAPGAGPHGSGPSTTRVVAEIVLVSVAVGLAAGLVWWLVAPEVLVGVRGESAVLIPAHARGLFGVDVAFGAVGAGAGLLLGALMVNRHRGRPTAVLAGLVLGGVAGSLVAWQVGSALGPGALGERTDGLADGATLAIPLDLQATGVVLFWPIMAVVAALVLAALTPGVPPRHRSRGEALSPGEQSEPWSPR